MTLHTRTLLQRALWGLALLLHLGAAAGTSAHHYDEPWGFGLSPAAVADAGEASEENRGPSTPGPDLDFDCVLCVAAHLQVLPQAAVDVEGLFSVRATFRLPESDRAIDRRPVLARQPRGPPPTCLSLRGS